MWNRTQKRPFNVVITTLKGHNGIFFMYYQFIERTLSSLLFIKHFSAPITKSKQLIIYATKINKNSDIFHYHALKILWRKLFSNKKNPPMRNVIGG